MTTMETPGLLEHILSKAETPRSDCMIWPGSVDRGYGRIGIDGASPKIHRVVWELQVGPIPEGLVIDHLCRIRSCVNTDHMELVTPEENTARRGPTGKRLDAPSRPRRSPTPMTHCRRGHLLPEPDGQKRFCRTCKQETNRQWYQRKARDAESPPTGRRRSVNRSGEDPAPSN